MKNPALLFLMLLASPLPAAGARYCITDSKGIPIPAKLTFLDADGKTPARLAVETKLPFWASRKGVVYTLPGDQEIPLPAGKYRVYVSHGFEWTIAILDVEVKTGSSAPARIEASLERVVDTTGYLSSDMHLHTLTFSGHGDTNVEERIITLCAENVEWAVATDHNHVTDYLPYVRKVAAEPWIKTTPGNEVTTTTMGHFNAFPFDRERPVVDWKITDPSELFRRMRAEGAEIVQVNHPRWTGARGAYFRDLDLSPHTGDSTNPSISYGFDSFEVVNGNDLNGWIFQPDFTTGNNPSFDYSVRDDWYNLLNQGRTFTAVGNSDSHHVDNVVAGCPRNFIRSSTDDPTQTNPQELMAAVRGGALSVSAGIFVEASVSGAVPGLLARVAPKGDPNAGEVAISIRVQAPPWIHADRLVVVSNGEEVSVLPLASPTGPSAIRYEGVYRDRPSRDSWYVVYAIGDEAPVPVQHETVFPLGFTNAIRVDADGDGHFTPLREHARRAVAQALRSGAPAVGLEKESASFRRQALGAIRDLESAGLAGELPSGSESIVRFLGAMARDPDGRTRACAAELLSFRSERSALLALLGARAAATDPLERVSLDFLLVKSGHLPALRDIQAAYALETGFRRYTIRRDLLELGRKVRIGPWKVLGPFPSSRWEDGLSIPLPAASDAALAARWRRSTVDKKSYLNLRDTMDPRIQAVAFARLDVRAAKAISTSFLLESENALRMFVGGKEVYRQGPRKGAAADLECVPVQIPAGSSDVLVQCVVERGAWGFQLFAIDPERALTLGNE